MIGTTGAELERVDPTFVSDLLASQAAVDRTVEWLASRGYEARAQPIAIRPSASVRSSYADSGDITLEQRIEVKHRPRLDFDSIESFPYPTVIVDVCHAYDRARPKPYAYVIWNAGLTCALVIRCRDTRRYWTRVEKDCSRSRGRRRWVYECPVRYAETVRVER